MPSPRSPNRKAPGLAGLLLLPASLILYILSFPNPLMPNGMGLLSLLVLAPAYAWLARRRFSAAIAAGFAYGMLAYACIAYWLGNYHPGALGLAMGVEGIRFGLAFGLSSIALKARDPVSPIFTVLLWSALECASSSGTLAFPYGTLPYALAAYRPALAAASVGGTALLGLISAAANYCAYRTLSFALSGPGSRLGALGWALVPALALAALALPAPPRSSSIVAAPLEGAGNRAPDGYYRVALVQANAAQKQRDVGDYRRAFEVLKGLTQAAAVAHPDLVVWHETAIIPSIEWHMRYRADRDTYELVSEIRSFAESLPFALLTGNGWADTEDPGMRVRENAAVLYDGAAAPRRYAKKMLVPFSEYYPLGAALPSFARWLEGKFGLFWTPGSGPTVLESRGARIAAPICFEDAFGPYMADFDGPDAYIVLTDDSWGRSAALQNQHLSMSIFRAAETASVVLRSAATGSTAAVATNGAVVAQLTPFSPGVLVADIRLGASVLTPYERWGRHLAGIIMALGAAAAVLAVCSRLWGGPFRIDKNAGV